MDGGKVRISCQQPFIPNQRGIIAPNTLCLRTFGGLWIEGSAGQAVPQPPPRRLALLALLAAAPRGLSRERLLGILWPDGNEDRGRHALAQSVYSLKRDFGNVAVIAGVSELRLDPAALGSDVAQLLLALQAGDHEGVARLYAGPFLDGFYLSDAPEFERWVEEERARLSASAIHAIGQLAASRERAGPGAEALTWWRRLTELDPLRGRFAAAYMSALAAAGDRAGALGHARVHEAALRRELDSAPESEVTRVVERLRREVEPSAQAVTAAPALPQAVPSVVSPARRRSVPAIAIVSSLLAIAAFLAWRSAQSPGAADLLPLAVGAVRDGASPDSAGSGAVLTDMLATSLARIPGLQVFANSRLLELIPRGMNIVPGTLPEAARRAGAREIIEGELTSAPDGGLRLELRRIDLVTGAVRRGYSVRARDRYAAVDSATAAIAAGFGLSAPTGPIAAVSTGSPVAYRMYEEGLRAFYQYDFAAAYRLMQAAQQEDSTFAMAAYYAWRSALMVDPGSEPVMRERARHLAPRAPDRERLLILGMTAMQVEDPAALAPAESLAIRYPADPDGQALYGQIQQARGDFRSAVAAFNRGVSLDSAASMSGDAVCRACENFHQLIWVYMAWDSLPAAERAVRAWERFRPNAPEPLSMLAQIRWRQERWAEADSALQRVGVLSTGPRDYQEARARAAILRGAYDEVGQAATAALREPDRNRRSEARWLWLIALRNQGRLREAMALAREGRVPGAEPLARGAFDADGITAAIVAFESGDYPEAARAYRALAAAAGEIEAPGHRARGVTWNLTHAGAAYAAGGDTATVRRLADSIEIIGPQSLFGRSARLHYFLRGLLLAAAGRHAEAVDAYRRAVLSWTDGYTRINYELARSLMALGRAPEAVAPLQAALHGGVDGSNLYVTRTELHELLAQVFVAMGQREDARREYAEVARAWEHADARFRVRRDLAVAGAAGSGR